MKYGYRSEGEKDIANLYMNTRSDGFGDEVKKSDMNRPRVFSQRQLPANLVKKLGITPYHEQIDAAVSDLQQSLNRVSNDPWLSSLNGDDLVVIRSK